MPNVHAKILKFSSACSTTSKGDGSTPGRTKDQRRSEGTQNQQVAEFKFQTNDTVAAERQNAMDNCPKIGAPTRCCMNLLSHHPAANHTELKIGEPHATVVSIDYESGRPRLEQFTRELLRDHLLTFATKYSDHQGLEVNYDGLEQLAKAAKNVYGTKKYKSRGEFGELILHALLESYFGTTIAVAKLAFKTARNETVKGFDAVHILNTDSGLEIWFGEAKFYTDANAAIRDITEEIEQHLSDSYMRDEFIPVTTMLDDCDPNKEAVKQLLNSRNTLDNIRANLVIPALITFECNTLTDPGLEQEAKYNILSQTSMRLLQTFGSKLGPRANKVRIQLILLPLESKQELLASLHAGLTRYQGI